MPDLVALRAMFGQDEVNHGTARYRVVAGGLIHVPREVAWYLVKNGGFAVERRTEVGEANREARHPCSPLLVQAHHPYSGRFNYRGCTYHADQQEDALVPANAVAALMGNGLVAVQSSQGVIGPSSADLAPAKHSGLEKFPFEETAAMNDSSGGRPNGIR